MLYVHVPSDNPTKNAVANKANKKSMILMKLVGDGVGLFCFKKKLES
jgi:hypothetical protein